MSVELVQKRNEIEAMLLQQARIAESNYIENVGSAGINAEKIPYYFKPVITRYLMKQKNVYSMASSELSNVDMMDPMYDEILQAREDVKNKFEVLNSLLEQFQQISKDYPLHVGSFSDANDRMHLKYLADMFSGNYKEFIIEDDQPVFVMEDKNKIPMASVSKMYNNMFRKASKENNQFMLIANESYNSALQRGEASWNEKMLKDRIYQILNNESGLEGTVDPRAKIERLLSLAYDRINGNPSFVDWLNEDPQRDPNNWVAEDIYDDGWIKQSIKIDPKMVMSGMVQWLLEQVSTQWRAGYEIYTSKQNEMKKDVAEQPDPNQETN